LHGTFVVWAGVIVDCEPLFVSIATLKLLLHIAVSQYLVFSKSHIDFTEDAASVSVGC